MGTVLAAAGGGEGGVNGSAPEARRNGHKQRKSLIFPSLAALAANFSSLAALARLSFGRICRICVEETAAVPRKASPEILILAPS